MLSNHKYFHWFYYKQKKHQYFNIGTGVILWLFIGISLKFGVSDSNSSNYFILIFILLPFGLVWPLVSYLTDMLIKNVFSIKANENYLIGFRVLLLKFLLLVHLVFVFRGILCFWSCLDWKEYLEIWFHCFLIIALAYVPFSLFARNKFLKSRVRFDINDEEDLFELKGDLKTTLKLKLENVIYLKSDDNYVDIITLDKDNELKTIVFRGRLKSVADQLEGENLFVRIHRSYIVNLRYLNGINKNESVKIRNADWEEELPISNKYLKDLLNLID